MPSLFAEHGEVFNHDRAWRIDYLSRFDESVERLDERVHPGRPEL